MTKKKKITKAIENAIYECGATDALPSVSSWCSTGCTVLDLALSNKHPGGIPIGRIVHAYGGTSACKSVLATTILGSALRKGALAFYDDVERTLDPSFAKLYGLDCSSSGFFMMHSTSLEDMFDNNINSIVSHKKIIDIEKVMAIDSVTALPSEAELEKDMTDGGFDTTRAKQMSKGFRKYIRQLAENNFTLFCIDQTRDNVGGFGKAETTSGGRALEFYSSVRLHLKIVKKIKNNEGTIIGVWIQFNIEKNKTAPPYRTGRFKILFDYGLDDIASNVFFLSEWQNGIAKAKKKLTKVQFDGKYVKAKTMIKYVEDNDLEDVLANTVVENWKKKFAPDDRKKRVWSKIDEKGDK